MNADLRTWAEIPWFEREWYQRSVLNHRHDATGRFLKPTPRRCIGLEPEQHWPDSHVFWGCLLGFFILLIFGHR